MHPVGVCKYVYIGSVAAHTHAHHEKPTERPNATRCTRQPNGAYGGQRSHARRVPRADVRVELFRPVERLRANHARSTAMLSGHNFIDTFAHVRRNTHTNAWHSYVELYAQMYVRTPPMPHKSAHEQEKFAARAADVRVEGQRLLERERAEPTRSTPME